MEKHTPGPWWEEPDSYQVPRIWARMSGGETCDVACTEGDGSIPFAERRANARLIAAAPDLLEALLKLGRETAPFIATAIGSRNPGILAAVKQANAAIAKAEGPSNENL